MSKKIEVELKKVKLELNNKTCIGIVSDGLVFLGYRFFNRNNRTYLLMNKNMRRKINKRYKKDGFIIIKKYNGYFQRCKSHKYRVNLFKKNDIK